jgi:hypothetical protein
MAAVRRVYPGTWEQVSYAYDGAIAIGIGDLLFHTGDDAKPASSQADQLTEPLNQKVFARQFAGVAAETKLSSDPAGTVQATREGVYDMDCVSATWEVGDLVGAKEQANGTQLENQRLVKVTDPDLALGYCVKREGTAKSRVRCRLAARTTPAGVPFPAASRLVSQTLVAAAGNPGGATSFTDFSGTLPAGALVLGWEANVAGAFAGDTTAVINVGVSGTVGKFTADAAQSAFTTGRRGSAAAAATAFQATAASPRVTVTGSADFTSIVTNAAGSMVVTLFYVPTY